MVGTNSFFMNRLKIVYDRDGLDHWSTLHMLHCRRYDCHVVLCVNSLKDLTNIVPKKGEWSHINVELESSRPGWTRGVLRKKEKRDSWEGGLLNPKTFVILATALKKP